MELSRQRQHRVRRPGERVHAGRRGRNHLARGPGQADAGCACGRDRRIRAARGRVRGVAGRSARMAGPSDARSHARGGAPLRVRVPHARQDGSVSADVPRDAAQVDRALHRRLREPAGQTGCQSRGSRPRFADGRRLRHPGVFPHLRMALQRTCRSSRQEQEARPEALLEFPPKGLPTAGRVDLLPGLDVKPRPDLCDATISHGHVGLDHSRRCDHAAGADDSIDLVGQAAANRSRKLPRTSIATATSWAVTDSAGL